jgi:hypothetical protein
MFKSRDVWLADCSPAPECSGQRFGLRTQRIRSCHTGNAHPFCFSLEVNPHFGHVLLVFLGSTSLVGTPASLALYSMNCLSWRKLQECWVRRWGFLTVIRGADALQILASACSDVGRGLTIIVCFTV